jgi:glycosyltransferase involved in cell wall biosynthesis
MKVFFDHQIFLTQRVGGVSRYFYNLKKALTDNKLCDVDNWAFIYRNSYLGKGNGAIYLERSGVKKIDDIIGTSTGLRYLGAINERFALRRLKKDDCDLVHVTADDARYITKANLKKPMVATVHDLIPELYPLHFPEIKGWLKQRENVFKMADHLICISESTKKDLKNIYGFSDNKITMVYHGPADYMVKNKEYALSNEQTHERENYILYVGDRKTPYKNFWAMVEALLPVIKDSKELKLLCVGSPFTPAEAGLINKMGLTDFIRSVQAREDELFSVYENAKCLILPSIYEGFGFPLLEAMKAGCPVLSSNSSSLPEVGGNSALYFNPVSFEGFTGQLIRILTDNDTKAKLLKIQAEILKKFSWKSTAEQTYGVYKRIVQSPASGLL